MEINRRCYVNKCCGCQKRIRSRYLVLALKKTWHERCLRCDECNEILFSFGDEKLYYKDGQKLCKLDYLKKFVPPNTCSLCEKPILPLDKAMKFKNDLNYHISCFKCIYCQNVYYPGDLVRIPKPKVILCLHHNEEDFKTFESCNNKIKDKLSTIPTNESPITSKTTNANKGSFSINSTQSGHTSPVDTNMTSSDVGHTSPEGPMNKITGSMGHTSLEHSMNKITSSMGHTTTANLLLNNQVSNSGLFHQLSMIRSKTISPYNRPQAEFSSIESYERRDKRAKNIHFGLAVS